MSLHNIFRLTEKHSLIRKDADFQNFGRSYQLKLVFSLFSLLIQTSNLFAQTPSKPVPVSLPPSVEFIAGNNTFGLQTQINRHFKDSEKFNFLSITNAVASYNNNLQDFDFINNSQVSYNFYKGFGISTGISINAKTGFSPTAGLQYVYATREVLVVIAPGILLTNNHNMQGVTVLEFKPSLKKNWGIYSRLQGYYNYNTDKDFHQRSYILARLGLSYKVVAFGLGSNWDWYGQTKLYKENYGIFLKYSFQ